MNTQAILKVIKGNKWLNGYYDMQNGDVMAMVVDKEYLKALCNITDKEDLFDKLKSLTGIYQYKHLIFANHWNYGCFLYAILKNSKLLRFEHLTISAYTYEKFTHDLTQWLKIQSEEDIQKYFSEEDD